MDPKHTLENHPIDFDRFGNQGAAQAQNLRDSGIPNDNILIANREDSYAVDAKSRGFKVEHDFGKAGAVADVLFLLIPDQVQPRVFNEQVAPSLKETATIVIASGYNVFYKLLNFQLKQDVVMVAPRMIGSSVRSLYEKGKGFPCFVSVEQDGSGNGLHTALALARAIGATRAGAISSSAREETAMDLFAEQALWPNIIMLFREAFSVLKEAGCSDEALCYEMWMSKEPAEIFERAAEDGFIQQLKHHSSVSQFGQLSGALALDGVATRQHFKDILYNQVLNGKFCEEFSKIEADLEKDGSDNPLNELYRKSEERNRTAQPRETENAETGQMKKDAEGAAVKIGTVSGIDLVTGTEQTEIVKGTESDAVRGTENEDTGVIGLAREVKVVTVNVTERTEIEGAKGRTISTILVTMVVRKGSGQRMIMRTLHHHLPQVRPHPHRVTVQDLPEETVPLTTKMEINTNPLRASPVYEAPQEENYNPDEPKEDDSEARSVFVSQLAARLTARDLGYFFEDKLGEGTVMDSRIVTDRLSRRSKGIGYVEFRSIDLVEKAIGLSGTVVMGLPIMVQLTESERNKLHPGDGNLNLPPGVSAPHGAMQFVNLQNIFAYTLIFEVERLYVGSLHFNLTESDIKQVFEPFGELEFVDLHRDPMTGRSKGYAFVQYKRVEDARMALEQMEGFELAGRTLRVNTVHEKGTARYTQQDSLDEAGAKPTITQSMQSRSVLLKNMFDPEEETERDWDRDLADDVRGECEEKYGPVEAIKVEKETQGEIYVKFDSIETAKKAIQGLHGRWFGGKQVSATFISDAIMQAHR
ncbi:hypothetical protein H0H81_010601 [Sphagnurus paluster]|uniref:Uncharacterized protein n=1 Tax=Sphagnurus paluster TaxID=117069 RepID=A0A9P7FP74_9AGAR|nr:hypothetical protein H0H81_010601 [Sphagnurus paluster]